MTTDKLTDATNVTLESATYENLTDDYTDDRTDEVEVSRWSKKGDRLYINGPAKYEKNSTYFDLVAGEMQDLPGSRDVTVERDGDTVTINVADTGGLGYDEEWTFVLELEFPADDDEDDEKSITFDEIEEIEEGDQFTDGETTISVVEVEGASNPAKTEITYDNGVTQPGEELHAAINKHGSIWPVETDGEDQDGPEIVADGGEDVTDHVDDETIEGTIAQHDDPDHPEATTVEEARDALAWLQMSIEEHWRDWLSNVENNESTVVYEDREVIVFATGEQNIPRRDLRQHYDGGLSERVPDVVSAIHHEMARERCDYDWGYEYPLVVRKPAGLEDGQQYVESIINGLQSRGLSPGQAWAYYGVEIRGNSRNSWGIRKGDHDHKNVSDALEKARRKLL